ncbi:MAG: NUDIX domain-containing protein [Methanocellales archaeon]
MRQRVRQIFIAVGAVIKNSEGKILLVQHKPERFGYWRGKWICPGGRLKLGESIEAGIKREVKEETNLDIELKEPLVPFERIVKKGREIELHVIYIDYIARIAGGDLKVGSDVGKAKFASRNEILEMWSELHEDTKKLLKIARII